MATNPVIPTPKSFVGKRKRTQAVATGIQQADDDFQGALKKFKPSSTTPVTVCPQPAQWGTGREKQAYSDIDSVQQIGFKSRTRADKKKLQNTSEEFGEMAVEHKLQEQLHDAGLPYDPTGVEKFSASGVFNIVYMYPPLGSNPAPTYKPDYVIVLEAKGGESQCGDRKSKMFNKRVTQGTPEYLMDVADTMSKSTYRSKSKKPADVAERKRRKSVGMAVSAAAKQKNDTVVYGGVRGGYGDTGAYNPESIFTKTI